MTDQELRDATAQALADWQAATPAQRGEALSHAARLAATVACRQCGSREAGHVCQQAGK